MLLCCAAKNNSIVQHNISKVYRLDFSEDMEEPLHKLMKPKHIFGLSDLDMILLRIYVYMVITLHCITIYFQHIDHNK